MFKRTIGILILITLLATSCSITKDNIGKTAESLNNANINENTKIVTGEIHNAEIAIGKRYKVKGLTNIYDSIDIFNKAKVIFRLTSNDDMVIVKEIKDDFAKIDFRDKEGWVLKWYLTKTLENEITQINKEPFEKVISKDSLFYTFPDENKSKGYEIKSGEVVHIMAEYMDWYCIELIEYENKTFVDKWVKKSNTIDLENSPTKVENPFDYRRTKVKDELIDFIQNAESIDMLSLGTGESYAQIKGKDIKYFTELIKDTTIGSNPDIENKYTSVEAELLIKIKGKERSIMLAKSYLQYFPLQRWQQNQDCLIFNNEDIYNKVKKLFGKKQ